MKRAVIFAVFAGLVLTAGRASADWKDWLRNRVPRAQVRIPNPMSKTGKPAVDVTADGRGVRNTGRVGGGIVATDKTDVSSRCSDHNRCGGSNQKQTTRDKGEVIVVPPNASREAPDFRGVTVAVNWFGLPARIIRLENNLQKELAKRSANFAYRSDEGNPCDVGGPAICFVVSRPVSVSSGYGSDGYSNSRSRGSSSGSSSSSYGGYVVTVRAYLVKGDSSAPLLLAERNENFIVTDRHYESWSWYSSRSGRSTSSSGSSSYSLENGELAILSEAARQAEGEIKYLLKPRSDESWIPGAAELVEETFRQ